jgi:hypothetical protein
MHCRTSDMSQSSVLVIRQDNLLRTRQLLVLVGERACSMAMLVVIK